MSHPLTLVLTLSVVLLLARQTPAWTTMQARIGRWRNDDRTGGA